MIYLLLEVFQSCDDGCESQRPVFASFSKKIVEKRHAELTKKNHFIARLWSELNEDERIYSNSLEKERPIMPNLKDEINYPIKPLVWNDGWKNAYMQNYNNELNLLNQKIQKFRNEKIKNLAITYSLDEEIIRNSYVEPSTYIVMEVESD